MLTKFEAATTLAQVDGDGLMANREMPESSAVHLIFLRE